MGWISVWFCFLTLSVASVPEVQARLVRNHVSSICSTWGTDHFKTFDGDMYQFPGTCEYNLVSDCHEVYQEFSVHMKRSNNDGIPTVTYVVVTISDIIYHLTKNQITVNEEPVSVPYFKAGVQLEQNAVYIKLQSKVGITLMWNGEDAVMVEIDNDYANRTCGLCGDFNTVPVYDEFIHEGRQINPIEFGNRQKVHRPNDECDDPYEGDEESSGPVNAQPDCKKFYTTCSDMLRSESWSSCTSQINPEPYIQACVQDMCSCGDTPNDFCVCSTLSEFSRQCSHAGGHPPKWRKTNFCAKQCPFNMVYKESGSPCMDTCSRRDTSSMCEDHKMDGCFCPSGTVFDDVSMKGCIPQSECHCKHDKIYESGEIYRQDREQCTCREGSWACQSLQAPETCSVEEGSHVTTFDGKTFTFHGGCYYTLAKVESKDGTSPKFTVLAQLMPCTNQEFDTCLKAVKLLVNNNKNNVITFTSDGIVKQNSQTIILPYRTGEISIFQASSFHILFQTNFGLQIKIQVVPVMQVYIRLEQSYTGKTRGLCGNYNMVLSDDMKTPQGIVEGTAATFTNSWKANLMCSDKEERLDDPCSFSVENEHYAKHWCALLRSQNSTFTPCHASVDPDIYYKRCTYSSCNCEKSEACLCGVFSSYAQACASKGVILPEWKENVCDKYMKSCPGSQVFSFKHQRCQLTCRSLALKEQNCISDFSPVDGCTCAEGSYLDDEGICVPVSKCPCYYNDVYIKPGKSVSIKDEHCVCTNGILHCHSWRLRSAACPSPKVFFNCSSGSLRDLGLQCARTCSNLDSDDCDFTECESGCRCPGRLLDDGKGSCVPEVECPCQHEGQVYPLGSKILNNCNTCTCRSGKWYCSKEKCPGSCIFYGSGHYSTFDEKTYGFPGDCAYVAVKNNCGNKAALNTFGIITENVPCGSSKSTCSKAIRIQLGDKEIKFSKNKFEEQDLGYGPEIEYKIRRVGLYLILESDIGLAVIWDRKTTVRIVLKPQHSGDVCGLCGNFDGDAQNDFMTQNNLVVNNALEFGNSWKVSSTCPDVIEQDNPCDVSPNRHHWAKMMCSLIIGPTFKDCKKRVDPLPFYENCVKDSCACDSGGDCECFCTAVAAYAQACSKADVCVSWRTPDICPIYCDYYNNPNECQWHYKPCHSACFKTCLNLEGVCTNPLPNLEGCYPICPEDKPIFDEKNQTCVAVCPTPPPPTTPPTTTTPFTTTTPPTTPPSTTTTTPPTTPPTTTTTTPPTTTTTTTTTPPTTPPTTTTPTPPPTTTTTTPPTTTTTTPPTTPPTTTTPTPTTTTTTTPPTTPPTTTTPTPPPTTTTTTPPTTTTTTPPTTPPTTTTPTPPTTTTPTTTTPTPPPTTTTTTPPTTTTTTPTPPVPTPPPPTCPQWNVTQNETFWICKCVKAICIEDNIIIVIPIVCPPPQEKTCENGLKPVLVKDSDECCPFYACPCVCEGWGDPHYITFDGLYYSYQGNCTYILMQEKKPKIDLTIYVDNVNCDPTEDVSCPRSLIISYKTQVITLVNHNLLGTPELEVLSNGKPQRLPYLYPGFKIVNTGINLVFEIPVLNVTVTFGLSGFRVDIPYELFGNNTQGHCGTCNNNQTDDCMLPGGQVVKDCAIMADFWPANDISQEKCPQPTVPPTSNPEPQPSLAPCKPNSMCDLLFKSPFTACHHVISPDKIYMGCVYDSCHMTNPAVECTSLQTYAASCAQAGICIYWRNYTNLCSSNCPANLVYKPCGPAEPPTCEDNEYEPTVNYTSEGCFCPEGTKLFNKNSQICVEKCGCIGPDGIPREVNESFEYKCQDCICEEFSRLVVCKPKTCPKPPVTECKEPGFELISQADPSNPCCTVSVCECKLSNCPITDMNCPVGFKPAIFFPPGKCCPEHRCEPKRVCVSKETEYLPGSSVPAPDCQECTCSHEVDPKTGLFLISCKIQECDRNCNPGYEYMHTDPDKCCGICVQTHCIVTLNGTTTHLLAQGETWSPNHDKCVYYTCIRGQDELITIISDVVCPPFEESNCQPGTIQKSANGCCKVCMEREKGCKLLEMKTIITHNGCQSQEIDMSYCEGSCNTYSMYSLAAEGMKYSCACCKELRSSNRTVDLLCLNGEKIPHTYMHVEECGCGQTGCTKATVHDRRRRSFTLI